MHSCIVISLVSSSDSIPQKYIKYFLITPRNISKIYFQISGCIMHADINVEPEDEIRFLCTSDVVDKLLKFCPALRKPNGIRVSSNKPIRIGIDYLSRQVQDRPWQR